MNYRIVPLQYEYNETEIVPYLKGYGLFLKNEETGVTELYFDLTNKVVLNKENFDKSSNDLFSFKKELDGFESLNDEEIYQLQDNILEFLSIYYSINYLSQQVLLTYQYMEKQQPFDKKYKGIHKLLEKGYMKNNEKINEFFDKECVNRHYGDRLKRKFNELKGKKELLENKKYIQTILELIKKEF